MRRAILLVALLTLVSEAGAQRPSPAITRQLVAARDSVWHAWFDNDTALLARIIPNALVAGGGRPVQWNDRAAELMESRKFAQSGARLERVTFANTRVTLDGDVAMVGSDYQLFIRSAERVDSIRGHAVELFVRQGNGWVNPFWRLARTETRLP